MEVNSLSLLLGYTSVWKTDICTALFYMIYMQHKFIADMLIFCLNIEVSSEDSTALHLLEEKQHFAGVDMCRVGFLLHLCMQLTSVKFESTVEHHAYDCN